MQNETSRKIEKLANQTIDQAIFISNLCDQFKHAETLSHSLAIADDITEHVIRLSKYQNFNERVRKIYGK